MSDVYILCTIREEELEMATEDIKGATHISSSEAREHFGDILSRAEYGGERFIIDRHHKAAAAIVSLEDAALLERIENEKITQKAEKARKEDDLEEWEDAKDDLSV